jgi:hypothetical protein
MSGLPTLQKRDAASPDVLRRRFARARREAAGCQRCELWARATQTVFGEGPVPAALMLVGEQPGDREDLDMLNGLVADLRVAANALPSAG